MFSQNKFELSEEKEVANIPFELINNLIVIKVDINGTELDMIFDTGVKQTILINLKSLDSLKFKKVKKRFFAGIGAENTGIEALSSNQNKVSLQNKVINNDALVYVITGVEFQFSENIGVNINGFIGGELVKDFIVKIDYRKRYLRFYNHRYFNSKLLKRYKSYPIEIINDKPYINTFVQVSKKIEKVDSLKLLIDTGNSDGLWFFNKNKLKLPDNHKTISDYFGLGFSGEVAGQRTKIYKFGFDNKYRFKKVYIGLPDSIYFKHITRRNPFDGLLGNEILRRFYIYLDYKNKVIWLKKYYKNYYNKFLFNNAGLFLAYDGKTPVVVKTIVTNFNSRENDGRIEIYREEKYIYQYRMVDRIVISHIRKNSPADKAGLMKGDILLKINGKDVYQYRLDELEKHFFYHNKKQLKLTVERKGVKLNFNVNNISQL